MESKQRLRNMTRYTYEFTSFQGWRVAVCRKHCRFVRYFSDLQYGGKAASLEAALTVRNRLMELLPLYPDDPAEAYAQCASLALPEINQETCGDCWRLIGRIRRSKKSQLSKNQVA